MEKKVGDPVQAAMRAQDKYNLDVSNALAPLVSPPSWTILMPANGWVIYSDSYTQPAYYQDASGRVWFRGVIKDGTLGVNLFSNAIPAPNKITTLICYTFTGVGYVSVRTNGTCNLESGGLDSLVLDSLNYMP
jgi:hypothetical protein